MPTPAANQGGAVIVTPLSDRYHRSGMPLEANNETPTPGKWYWGGDVTTIVIRPELAQHGIPDPVIPRRGELDVRKFLPGIGGGS